MKLYSLPQIYDIAFSWDVGDEIKFFSGLFARYVPFPVQKILEPACGPGRLLRSLPEDGYQVLGYDNSVETVEFANRRLKELSLADASRAVVGNMVDFKFSPPLDAAINSINSIGYLLEDDDVISHYRNLGDSLRPGAIYIVHCSCAWDQVPPVAEGKENAWTFKRDDMKVRTCWWIESEDRSAKRSHHVCRMEIETREESEVLEELHELRLWTLEDLRSLAARSGRFRLDSIYNEKFEPVSMTQHISGELGNLYFIFARV
jgi:SAM-dependent methyltransferase